MDTSKLFSTADRGLHGSKRQLGPCLSGTSPRVWTGAVQQLWCVSPAGLLLGLFLVQVQLIKAWHSPNFVNT